MTRTEVGLRARAVFSVPGNGTVLWVGRDAAWLRLPGGIAGLAGWSAPAGPLWARTDGPRRLASGSRVQVLPGGDLQIGKTVVALAEAPNWIGRLPAGFDGTAAAVADDALSGARLSSLTGPAGAHRIPVARRCLAHGDLAGAAAVLGGFGPGLTPAGDDVLVGILMAGRARRGPDAEADLVAVAGSVQTTELSRAFLRCAARGQHIAPVHDLLMAAAGGDAGGARRAVAALSAFGSSSGADVALGLRIGLAAQLVTTTSMSETTRMVLDT